MRDQAIVYTNENCIGCNKCIKVCSAIGACISREENGKARIVVDGSKCVACGSCIDVCVHGAREFEDDTERFFADLRAGERISLLLAPAFIANYPDEADTVLGGLKSLGVNRIISVSFGADITTWGYLNYIDRHGFVGGISQPCPAVVSYIERYLPELLPKLFPVQSPLMCAAIYARKEMGITDRFAFISPCIAKKLEIEDPHNAGLVQYNVTFDHLMRYVRQHGIQGLSVHSEIEYGLGSYYPTPGGLAETVRWFLGDHIFIRQVEGERHLYGWLHQNAGRIRDSRTPYLFIDALNCERGCICGTAVEQEKSETEDALYALLKIREESKKEKSGDAWSRPDPPDERLKNFNRQFAHLTLEDYLRGYTDRSEECRYEIPDEETLDGIFNSMNKLTKESREINCTCCGYENCRQMATAIHNGFNHRENCIYYEKAMVRELGESKKIAEEATRAKSAFLANMSHEIRTPINAVLGMDELILRESSEETIRQYAANIQRSGNMLLSLINDVLDFSKIEAGKMELVNGEYDLSLLVQDLADMIRPRAEDKGLTFHLEMDGRIPRYLFGDSVRIKQCMLNLLTNAVKYTETGEVHFFIGMEETDGDAGRLRVCVRDTGIGIKKEDLDRLFMAFERFDQNRNQTVEGTGLGMTIVQRLLTMMGSSLEVESEYGSGSSFAFMVWQKITRNEPVGEIALSERATERLGHYHESFTAPDARILIVDDTEVNLLVIRGLLKQTLVGVDTALSGVEALEKLRESTYDILFFDHMMPEMNGIELLRRLRAQKGNPNNEKPCIILTANAVSGAREEYLERGFDDYMSKPVDAMALEKLLTRYLPGDKVILSEKRAEEPTDVQKPQGEGVWGSALKERGIDTASGIKNCGSEEIYRQTLEIFLDSIPAKSKEIEGLYEAADWPAYAIEVHALKSTGRIIGAAEFGEHAQKLEDAGKAGDAAFIRAHHEPFMSAYHQMAAALRELSDDKQEEAPRAGRPVADASILESALEAIGEAAAAMDIVAVEEVLGDLAEYEIPPGQQAVLDAVRACCGSMDYDGILKALQASETVQDDPTT
ncbi:MAG: response regulator [Lachnospiraceae bacterium]|nr:response regulator [Lachnospiraceae bacterium]